ncbi:hypothetical protein DI392_08370 [Vibrio albus]|uniref:Glycine zipper 2TM domain-containing protein n=1 Tax=Vibrio albus TaxID=2200953 RepID=A0A2U3B9M5_9VIBR|nr:glycine zipper 2TM domain-containing protein [Vibrio albus]PWI33477.1 hypothetical protein DI392_08370 [Vibrio albus]
MKKLTVTAIIITACLSTNVMAREHARYDYARVVSSTPVYDHIARRVPIQTCRNNDHRYHSPRPKDSSVVPVVVGGVIGGAVGHSIGSSRTDKQIGMIAGTVIGATIGANIEQGGQHHHQAPGHQCSTTYQVEYEQVLIGFDVIYQYHGHRYHTHTKHRPNKRIQVPVKGRPGRKHIKGHPGNVAMNPRHHDKRY